MVVKRVRFAKVNHSLSQSRIALAIDEHHK
jgi:hypothetical protein